MKTLTKSSQKKRGYFKNQWQMILCLIGTAFLLVACPPQTPPCETSVENADEILATINAHPAIVELDTILTRSNNYGISDCYDDGEAFVYLRYEIPTSFSDYQISYMDGINIGYSIDGIVTFYENTYHRSLPVSASAVVENIQQKISDFESHPQVEEFISKMGINTKFFPISLLSSVVSFHGNEGWLEYVQGPPGFVRGFGVPNSLKWENFPEIYEAHKIIQEHLFVGEYADCSINQNSYTGSSFRHSNASNWLLRVGVLCGETDRSVFLELNPDGTFKRLDFTK